MRVLEVTARGAGTVARCTLGDGLPERVQELPSWMLDAAACRTMRSATRPEASMPALAALGALLSEALMRSETAAEVPEGGAVGSGDRHRGDRHAAPTPPLAEPAVGVVPGRDGASSERTLLGDVAGADPAGADGADDAPADRARRRRDARAGGRR